MHAVLITLGLLGCAAVLYSVYVIVVASRRYTPEGVAHPHARPQVVRSGHDRRVDTVDAGFPLQLAGGEIILADRRRGERRRILA
jgi:hypothetical protein